MIFYFSILINNTNMKFHTNVITIEKPSSINILLYDPFINLLSKCSIYSSRSFPPAVAAATHVTVKSLFHSKPRERFASSLRPRDNASSFKIKDRTREKGVYLAGASQRVGACARDRLVTEATCERVNVRYICAREKIRTARGDLCRKRSAEMKGFFFTLVFD